MKLNLLMLLILIFGSSCQQIIDLNKTKPVIIDGLGSLSALKDKELDKDQFLKVVKTVNRQNRVNNEDARAMLEIYKRQADEFLNASSFFNASSGIAAASDVEKYLQLILERENLRDEVSLTTQAAILSQVERAATFDEKAETFIGDSAGSLAGIYVNAYRQAAAKTDDEKRSVLNKQQEANLLTTVRGFEQAATEITEGHRENTTNEQKKNARQFVADLKTFNDSLAQDAKILDENGRLINPAQMNGRQSGNLSDIFGQGSYDEARSRLYKRMNSTLDKLRVSTQNHLK